MKNPTSYILTTTFKSYIFYLIFVLFCGCVDNQNLSNENQSITSLIFTCPNYTPVMPPPRNIKIFDCVPDSNCSRMDLLPCNFTTMELYADAVACELSKFLNYCPRKTGKDCDAIRTTVCFQPSVPLSFFLAHPNSDIWNYCRTSNCNPYICTVRTTPYNYHLPLSISEQDNIINNIIFFDGPLHAPTCSFSSTGKMEVEYVKLYTYDNGLYCSSEDLCYNYSIIAEVKYACYIPGGNCW